MTDGLKDAHREAIVAAIAANDHVERAVLFGSRATGANTVTSDVDIALFGERLTLTDQARLAAALDELPMAQRVDLLLYRTIDNPALREQIERHGVEWYRRPPISESLDRASEWKEMPLNELYDFRSGLSKPRSEFGSGYGFLSFKDVFYNFFVPEVLTELVRSTERERQFCSIRKGDVFLTRTSETMEDLGMSCVALKDYDGATFNGFTKRLRPRANANIVPEYAAYFFRSPVFRKDVTAMSSLSTRASLNNEMLGRLRMILPPPREQAAIAFVLKHLDDKIELNRRMNGTLEAMARAIFKDWFVDFGPTRARMAMRGEDPQNRNTARKPYLAQEIWDLFPDRLDDQGKPEGWHRTPLSHFMTFTGGSQPSAKEFIDQPEDGYIRLLQIRDFYTDSHVTYVPQSKHLRLVEEDDICIGRYGSGTGDAKDSLGRLCRGKAGAINVALVRVAPQFDCREYLATFIGSGRFREMVSGSSSRAVQAGFRKDDLEFIEVVRANDALHQAFENFGMLVWNKTKQMRRENRTLAELRDTLLPKLMSGEIRVAEAEKAAEAAA